MTRPRLVRISNSAVVPEYRRREQLLRVRHGYDVHIVSPPAFQEGGVFVTASPDPVVPVHIVNIRGRPSNPNLFWYSCSQLRGVLSKLRPDIVDVQAEPYSLAASAALFTVRSEAPNARVCIYAAQNILKRYPPPFRQLERRVLDLADAAYPCSSEAAGVLRAKGFSGAVHVLPLGVTVLPDNVPRTPSAHLRIGFLGRLEPYKGGELAIRAFAQAAQGIEASLEIVGGGSQRAKLEACALELDLQRQVVFRGAVPQAEALSLLAGYDVVLVPSVTTPRWKEQFGRVPAQALAAGIPVIASDSGSLPEVLGGCGELVPEGDVVAFARALRGLMLDPERRAELGALGRQRAATSFSWEALAEGCHQMYQQMLEGARRMDDDHGSLFSTNSSDHGSALLARHLR